MTGLQTTTPGESVPRALITDDHADSRDFLAEVLRAEGWQVSVARDGAEAIEAGKAFRPHLVLLDIWMPRMDGIQACLHMRNDGPFATTVFYAVTADPKNATDHRTRR